MNILINCSNLKKGGGLQVADSVCCSLKSFDKHRFVVVLSDYLDFTALRIEKYENVVLVRHNILNSSETLLLGRDAILDELVEKWNIEVVLTIFGPARWKPRCKHVCGFARPHLVLKDSPYFKRMTKKAYIKCKIYNLILKYFFGRGVDVFWTENPYISKKLEKLFPNKPVYTVSNYYNQVFDQAENCKQIKLPRFEGSTILSVNAPYAHKNMEIAIDVAKILKVNYPNFLFRFVMTMRECDYPLLPKDLKSNFIFVGKVDISEIPSLYEQADLSFQPSLLECFTATYPESMRMGVPIVTSDLDFAHGLCGDAAVYYEAMNAKACSDAIYKVLTDPKLSSKLIDNGKTQLQKFDNYRERVNKLINICEICK